MPDERGTRNLLDQIWELWIGPELDRRRQSGGLPDGFKISRCLIKLPKDQPPLVEFNEEIRWITKVKVPPGTSLVKGDPVFLHQIQEIIAVNPPEVGGQRVAFVYLFWTGNQYHILFDFAPNAPDEVMSKDAKDAWHFSQAIAESLQAILVERTIRIHDDVQDQLRKIGLWAAPALLPYPLSKIAKYLKEDDIPNARRTLVRYCTPDYLEKLSSKWWNTRQFNDRRKVINEALHNHREEHCHSSIYSLLPQVEGIVTDWICTKLPESEIPWRLESKTKKLRDLVLDVPPTSYTYRRIVDSAVDFIVNGPVLNTFKRWLDQINEAFPNRHAVEHGKHDDSLFTEENSLKLFLLLDTIYHVISAQSN